MPHTLLVPHPTRERVAEYRSALQSGQLQAGQRLAAELETLDPTRWTDAALLEALVHTKAPRIFAESEVAGDGSDWNLTELRILGDLSFAVPVTVFDNGSHHAPDVHPEPFTAILVFTPGALLRNGRGQPPADWAEVTQPDGTICPDRFFGLHERRLLPVLRHVDACAAAAGTSAFLTVPGLGCGQFAGPFRGTLGSTLHEVLGRLLMKHGAQFPNLRAIYFDPYNEGSNARSSLHGISLMVRPLLRGNQQKPQLCPPSAYAEDGDDFQTCLPASIVAWDHVSWPGNDFFGGNRCTDDGVKAAATDLMFQLTGIEGRYDPAQNAYLPPPPFHTWGDVVASNALGLEFTIP